MAHQTAGICKKNSEVTVLTNNHRRGFINGDVPAPYDTDSTGYGHEVSQVTLKNSEKYALDAAGAQHGQFAPVILWDLYVQSHAKDVIRQFKFGSTRERITSPTYCDGSTDIHLRKTFNKFLSESMDAKIQEWQDSNIALPSVLKLPEQAQLQKRSVSLAFLDGELEKAKLSVQGNLSGRAKGPAIEASVEGLLSISTRRRES